MPLVPPPNPQPVAPLPADTGVPLIDMNRQYALLEKQILAAIKRVCSSGRFVLGPDCSDLERAVAGYCQTKHAIACASGSDALLLALMACGVDSGDEVIAPSYTFFATAAAVARLGAVPVFVDIEPDGFNLDPAKLEAAVTPATKAIIPVHLYGQCAEMEPIMTVAQRHGLTVIEDAAQAIGAEYRGQRAGSIGQMGCLSFYPTKNLGGFGDGGMLTTNDDHLADKLRLLRVHGMQPRYYHQVLGINSRLDSLQAAVLNVKLPHLNRWTELRQAHAERYTELFRSHRLEGVLALPPALPDRRHVWNQYIVRVPGGRRDALRAHLSQKKIGSEIYYPVPLHQQQCFGYLGVRPGSLPETDRAAAETLALPIFPELTPAEQTLVVQEIAAFFGAFAADAGHALEGPKFLKRPAGKKNAKTR
ncbi:MAG TPA: DegT/DnrJ/EryC1/StrS family aminotransferase [Pirellulales bacterium]|nr:DegT/DnrJ/EryC1/StrS family aminotransferase [Pirellulales bacterium]